MIRSVLSAALMASALSLPAFAGTCLEKQAAAQVTPASGETFQLAMNHGDHGAQDAAAKQDIVAVASGNADFSTLVTALKAADLVATLQGEGPFTVFAPTNAAFAKLPAGTLENLLKPENKAQLAAILTYHVVPGRTLAADLAGKTLDVATVQGGTIAVDGTDGVKVNDAAVTAADILAANGVIHVIDAVILPPAAPGASN